MSSNPQPPSPSGSLCAAPPPDGWRMIGRLWQNASLRKALLDLQDRAGADVLWMLWLWRQLRGTAERETLLGDPDLIAHSMRTEPHRQRVRRIRALRRRMQEWPQPRYSDHAGRSNASGDLGPGASAPGIQRLHSASTDALGTLELTAERLYWRDLTSRPLHSAGHNQPDVDSQGHDVRAFDSDGSGVRPTPQERFMRLALLGRDTRPEPHPVTASPESATEATALATTLAQLWDRLEASV